ncbi:MAG: hypothetical protein WCD18_09455 [Thermosynechococcaceae cyanobacterium]
MVLTQMFSASRLRFAYASPDIDSDNPLDKITDQERKKVKNRVARPLPEMKYSSLKDAKYKPKISKNALGIWEAIPANKLDYTIKKYLKQVL